MLDRHNQMENASRPSSSDGGRWNQCGRIRRRDSGAAIDLIRTPPDRRRERGSTTRDTLSPQGHHQRRQPFPRVYVELDVCAG